MRPRRRRGLAGTALAALVASHAMAGGARAEAPIVLEGVEAAATSLTVEAPQTSWFLDERRAIFSGGVVARRGDVDLRCAELIVYYGADGTFERAEATGEVVAARDRWTARGERASLDVRAGLLALEGEPSVEDGVNTLEGARVVLSLDEERVDCEQCRVVIRE